MLIAFDMDGTLFDTRNEIISALNIVLRKKSIREISDNESYIFVGPPFKNTLLKYRGITDNESETITKEFREEYIKIVAKSKPFEGVCDVLQILYHKGVKLCIATNKPTLQVNILLNKYRLNNYFIITKEEKNDGEKKSNALMRIRKLFPNEEKYYMVGDTVGDLVAAEEAEFEFIEASFGYGKFVNKNVLKINRFEDVLVVIESA